ncbi:phage GP46 family protein [Lysobacter sp. GCM10012299]|uniref:phage GP46 family protein n=1 Tax=Lysobacter sp. GCM10012299 TaxID=3317333 RepID=UPI003614CF0E
MKQDVLIRASRELVYDLQLDGADFASAGGFETAIPVSLFTDARAAASQVADPRSRRGWIGNVLQEGFRQLGSTAWVYEQSRMDQRTVNGLREAVYGALAWMVEDRAVQSIDVKVVPTQHHVTIEIAMHNQDGSVTGFNALWRSTSVAAIPVA